MHVLPEPRVERKYPMQAVKTALGNLWSKKKALGLPIEQRQSVPRLPRGSDVFSVDLWDFFQLAEEGKISQAYAMVKDVKRLKLPESGAGYESYWSLTVDRFARVREEVIEKANARWGRARKTKEMRDRMLARSLVPWTEPLVPIGEVREKMEAIEFPWSLLRSKVPAVPTGTLQAYLASLLEADDRAHPERLLVTGGHGCGKTLAAIAGFLLLSDGLAESEDELAVRPIVFVDGYADATEPDFASDRWLEAQLRGGDGPERPIVIMTHADAFLRQAGDQLPAVLGWRLFRDCDLLLCASEHFYEQHLKYTEYLTYVARLEPWSEDHQDSYADALFGIERMEDLRTWRAEDPSGLRTDLCKVPLQLSFLLPLIRRESPERERISMPWHLLDQIARERLSASHLPHVEDYLVELAAVAHKFYGPGDSVGFTLVQLEDFLKSREHTDIKKAVGLLVDETLITFPTKVSNEYRFERAVWGHFFTAYHLANTLTLRGATESPIKAFGRPFSAKVLDFCREMLAEWMPLHEETIVESLRSALADGAEARDARQREIARAQLADLQSFLVGAA
jgi:hypothetical protein